MTKTLSMASHNNYNLNASDNFVIFLTSKLFTCFIGGFTLKMNSQSIVYLLNENEYIYILDFGPWRWSALNMEFVEKWPSRMQECNGFFEKWAGRTKNFGRIQKISVSLWGSWPCPYLPPRKARRGRMLPSMCNSLKCWFEHPLPKPQNVVGKGGRNQKKSAYRQGIGSISSLHLRRSYGCDDGNKMMGCNFPTITLDSDSQE